MPGTGEIHAMCDVGLQVSGRFLASEWPCAAPPRNSGQFGEGEAGAVGAADEVTASARAAAERRAILESMWRFIRRVKRLTIKKHAVSGFSDA